MVTLIKTARTWSFSLRAGLIDLTHILLLFHSNSCSHAQTETPCSCVKLGKRLKKDDMIIVSGNVIILFHHFFDENTVLLLIISLWQIVFHLVMKWLFQGSFFKGTIKIHFHSLFFSYTIQQGKSSHTLTLFNFHHQLQLFLPFY